MALIPAVNCWAIIIRPLRGLEASRRSRTLTGFGDVSWHPNQGRRPRLDWRGFTRADLCFRSAASSLCSAAKSSNIHVKPQSSAASSLYRAAQSPHIHVKPRNSAAWSLDSAAKSPNIHVKPQNSAASSLCSAAKSPNMYV